MIIYQNIITENLASKYSDIYFISGKVHLSEWRELDNINLQ